MEVLMTIDRQLIKALREAKAWSQDHLAQVSGVSLRTIQRVEAEGTASADTRMAIASALGITPGELSGPPAHRAINQTGARWGALFGFLGVGVGAAGACAGVLSGSPSGSEAGFALALIGIGVGLSAAMVGVASNRFLRAKPKTV